MSPTNTNTNRSAGFFSATNLTKLKSIFLKATIVLFSISALLAIFAVLFSGGEFIFKIIATTLLFGLFSLISTNNIWRLNSERKVVKISAAISLIASIIWLVLWVCALWGIIRYTSGGNNLFYEFASRLTATGLVVSIITTMTSSFMSFCTTDTLVRIFSYATITSAIILGGFILFEVWTGITLINTLWRLYLILLILTVFGAVTTPILVRVKQSKASRK